jgi:hypothetical protein
MRNYSFNEVGSWYEKQFFNEVGSGYVKLFWIDIIALTSNHKTQEILQKAQKRLKPFFQKTVI